MLMNEVLSLICGITLTFTGLWLKEIYFPNKKKRYFNKHKSLCYIELDRVCLEIKRSVTAQSCYIAYFHNGGTFINGISMDKYTVVGESYMQHMSSYKKRYVNCMINNYAYAFHRVIVDGKYTLDVSDLIGHCEDRLFVEDLNKRGVRRAYIYLIKDPIKDLPLGFIAIEFDTEHGVILNDSMIWKHQNRIANLLNQTYTEK